MLFYKPYYVISSIEQRHIALYSPYTWLPMALYLTEAMGLALILLAYKGMACSRRHLALRAT